MSPYVTSLEHISDVSHYFKDNKDTSKTFIGETLEIRIPRKFSGHGMLEIYDKVNTLGIFDMIFDDKYHAALNILGSIVISPSDISQMTYDGVEYVALHLKHGDTFMESSRIVQDQHCIYVIWTEFFTGGALPYWFTYESTLAIFQHVKELTGAGIGVSRSVFEGIITHLARDRDDLTKPYRLTDMKKPMKLIPLKSVSLATSGTIARLNGAYFRDEGLTSAVLYEVDKPQPFENLLRGLSTSTVEDKGDAIL